MKLLPSAAVQAARGLYDDGEPTAAGQQALAALEEQTRARAAAHRREQFTPVHVGAVVLALFFVFVAAMSMPARSSPSADHWAVLAVVAAAGVALYVRACLRCEAKVALHTQMLQRQQRQTIETWQEISAMSGPDYERLLRNTQRAETAGRLAKLMGRAGVGVGKIALKGALSGDLSNALSVWSYVDGHH